MKEELIVDATVENLETVREFINKTLEPHNCNPRALMQLDLVVEEIFVNIASYAYSPTTGKAKIELDMSAKPLEIDLTFIDSGTPYNPLEQADPDLTASIDERPIGGLGIFLTKKLVDSISYDYVDGQNVLRFRKSLGVAK